MEFQNSPLRGIQRDNSYTYGDSGIDSKTGIARTSGRAGMLGSPAGPNASILLPALNIEPEAPVRNRRRSLYRRRRQSIKERTFFPGQSGFWLCA
jgi:hypothetical protein